MAYDSICVCRITNAPGPERTVVTKNQQHFLPISHFLCSLFPDDCIFRVFNEGFSKFIFRFFVELRTEVTYCVVQICTWIGFRISNISSNSTPFSKNPIIFFTVAVRLEQLNYIKSIKTIVNVNFGQMYIIVPFSIVIRVRFICMFAI